ncbi:MAG: glycine dehydrogenase (aminomethyl-transferring), partial [Acidobacteria bacterium]|nr:glycine dehydrogenase (aminomethyl-transferring) [Acidobacteriota bacterium]
MSEAAADLFEQRHVGPRPADVDRMLDVVGAPSLGALIDQAVPAGIRLAEPLDLPDPEPEARYLDRLRAIGARNERWRSFIGQGYHDCVTPSVILRNVLENPGWYTPYTPYQAEAAQGRLEGLLTFQTVVEDLTAMEVANASLLDEATAAAEAMTLAHRIRARRPGSANRFVVAAGCFPQTVAVVRGRAEPLGIEVVVAEPDALDRAIDEAGGETFGVLVQSPDAHGAVRDVGAAAERAHEAGALAIVASDLLALTLVRPPGELGA